MDKHPFEAAIEILQNKVDEYEGTICVKWLGHLKKAIAVLREWPREAEKVEAIKSALNATQLAHQKMCKEVAELRAELKRVAPLVEAAKGVDRKLLLEELNAAFNAYWQSVYGISEQRKLAKDQIRALLAALPAQGKEGDLAALLEEHGRLVEAIK